jgi:hypothetical protein
MSSQLMLDGIEQPVGSSGRPSDDFYRTPAPVTRKLLQLGGIPAPFRVLDSGAGEGHLGRVLEQHWPQLQQPNAIVAVEQDGARVENRSLPAGPSGAGPPGMRPDLPGEEVPDAT